MFVVGEASKIRGLSSRATAATATAINSLTVDKSPELFLLPAPPSLCELGVKNKKIDGLVTLNNNQHTN